MTAPRDTIHSAFSQSQYPTPYGDNTIPGSTPGVRQRHLGRSPAPYPSTSLNTALEVRPYPYDPHAVKEDAVLLAHQDAQRERGDRNHLKEPSYGSRYILNSTNGGRRHYNEPKSGEQQWVPSKQYVPPPGENHTDTAHRKGKGVFNFGVSEGALTKEAERSLQQRQERELHQGRQYVVPPPDHSPVELGMANVLTSAPSGPRPTAKVDPVASPPPSPPPETRQSGGGGGPTSSPKVDEKAPQPTQGTYVSSIRPPLENTTFQKENKIAKAEFRQTIKREKEKSSKKSEVESVRNLPDW